MNKPILGLIGFGLVTLAAGVLVLRQTHSHPAVDTPVHESEVPLSAVVAPVPAGRAMESTTAVSSVPESAVDSAPVAVLTPPARVAAPEASMAKPAVTLSQPVQTLVSPQVSHAQRLAAWNELRDTGRLNATIASLEEAAKADPSAAEYPALLGQAYIQKLTITQDTREKVMLAMHADQSFDQALKLDPANWDARYSKAEALSYWPAEMNKSEEVMQNLVTLAEQQETQPLQPHFAQTYILLGAQYQKAGYADYAKQTWQRGAALFPGNDALRQKLAGSP